MFATPVRVLVVGLTSPNTQATLERWKRAGWGSHMVSSVQEAQTVLKTIRFKVILAAESVRDGSGYELAALVARQSGNLFISVALSETCLWLPVIERGVRSLGKRAINSWVLESEVEGVLRGYDADARAALGENSPGGILAGPTVDARGISAGAGAHLDETNLLHPANPATAANSRRYPGLVPAIPSHRMASSGDGSAEGMETPTPRAANRASGAHGKRRSG
jgi:hypothetical protein